MTSKMNQTSDDKFGEYVLHSTGSLLHVPLDPRIKTPATFKKVKLQSNCGDSELGTTTTRLEQIHKPKRLEVTCEPKTEEMKNHLIFERDLKWFEYFGVVLGVHFQFHWKPGIMFLISLFLISVTISQLTYTQYLHINNQNYHRILETLACYGITISMLIKIWTFLTNYKRARALHNCIIKVSKANETGRQAVRVRDRLLFNSRFYKWTTIVIMASLSIFLAYPTKAFIFDHELISLLPIEYMFVDSSTVFGFITANAISSLLGLFANIATAYSILLIVSLTLNYSVFVDVFEVDVKSLDEMWSGTTDTSVTCRHSFLKNMCRKQQDMDAYMKDVKLVLDDYIFYYFIASYLGQIICLFQIVVTLMVLTILKTIVQSDWKSGYAIAYGMFLEMMFYCLMGTKISSDNERVTSALHQSNWYSYDICSQKAFLTLWVASTNAKEMWIGQLAPLSVLTGTNIVKSIYTYYNIMLEVV